MNSKHLKYTDLIFDLYGTLVDIHTDQDKMELWEKTALYMGFHGAHYDAKELQAEFDRLIKAAESDAAQKEETLNMPASNMVISASDEDMTVSNITLPASQAYECFPELQIEKVFEDMYRAKGISENLQQLSISTAQLFRVISIEFIRLYPGVKEALKMLRQKGFRLWILSNAQHVFTAGEIRFFGLEEFFDGIYLSSDYGCKKPDRRFFNQLIEEQKLDKSCALMIGNDLSTDICGAKNVGLPGFYMHTNLSPAEDAEALLEPTSARPKPDYVFEGTNWLKIAEQILEIR